MTEVNASEVLGELLDLSRNLAEMMKLQNFQYTLILKRIGDIENLVKQNIAERQAPAQQPVRQQAPSVVAMEKVPNLPSPSQQKQLTKLGDGVFSEISHVKDLSRQLPPKPAEDDFNFSSSTEGGTAEETSTEYKGEVPVTQLIYTPQGKPVCLAVVEVKNEAGEVVQKLKTNSVGRWQTLLRPGRYTSHVLRKYDTEVIEFEQSFDIVFSNKTIEVPAPEQYKRKPNPNLKSSK